MLPLVYIPDSDLEFLAYRPHEDLAQLADILTFDKGQPRKTAQLPSEPRFIDKANKLDVVWEIIAAELQRFGADTVASFVRGGKGVLYREILADVCKQLKVTFSEGDDVPGAEGRVLLKVVEVSLEKMTEEERAAFVKSAAEDFAGGVFDIKNASVPAIMAALQSAIAAGGFAAFQVATIVANAVTTFVLGRGLGLAANAGLMRMMGMFAGPIGWAVTGILSVPLVSGPAFRVTIPAVITVAYLRTKNRLP